METVNYKAQGTVFNIQRFSVHDGPGIRTIAFLKGCPLACLWCCNPESQRLEPEIMFQPDNCVKCGRCVKACTQGAIKPGSRGLIDRTICTGCGECASVCPTSALVLKGEHMTVEQVVKEFKKDGTNYRRSKGGITISGGEPLVQWQFVRELLKACKAQGWHTAMETTAMAGKQAIEEVCPYLDLALLDIKAIDCQLHKSATGVSNDIILNNAKRIAEITQVVVRVPTVPGINATAVEIGRICQFAKSLNGVDTLHLLPYHTYGENKYALLGTDYPMGNTQTLANEEIEGLSAIVKDAGLKCVIGG